jgi:hypothetical protein
MKVRQVVRCSPCPQPACPCCCRTAAQQGGAWPTRCMPSNLPAHCRRIHAARRAGAVTVACIETCLVARAGAVTLGCAGGEVLHTPRWGVQEANCPSHVTGPGCRRRTGPVTLPARVQEANRRRDKQKSVLMRLHEPIFAVAVEMHERSRWVALTPHAIPYTTRHPLHHTHSWCPLHHGAGVVYTKRLAGLKDTLIAYRLLYTSRHPLHRTARRT